MTFEESGLRFTFDSDWLGVKWDETNACREVQKSHDGVGSVDFVGLHRPTRQLYVIEMKNYRADRRKKTEPLEAEMARKVLGTTAGLVGSARRESNGIEGQLGQALANRHTPVNVVVWLELPAFRSLFGRSAATTIKADDLKRRIRWLGSRAQVLITSRAAHRLPGLTVESLPASPNVRS